jgi:hypothetical protein
VNPQLNQCITITRISGFSKPFNSRPEVANLPVRYRDVLSSDHIPGMKCFSQPEEGFIDILPDSISIAEHNSQRVLGSARTVLCGAPKPLGRFPAGASYNDLSSVVLASVAIAICYLPFRFWVTTLCSGQQRLPLRRRHLVRV